MYVLLFVEYVLSSNVKPYIAVQSDRYNRVNSETTSSRFYYEEKNSTDERRIELRSLKKCNTWIDKVEEACLGGRWKCSMEIHKMLG